jgi:hypothetical protein
MLGYNKLSYNKLGNNKLGNNKLPVISNVSQNLVTVIRPFPIYNKENPSKNILKFFSFKLLSTKHINYKKY